MFGTINIGGQLTFSLYVESCHCCHDIWRLIIPFFSLIPETKGRSLEEMDIIFGAVSAEEREAYIARQQKGAQRPL